MEDDTGLTRIVFEPRRKRSVSVASPRGATAAQRAYNSIAFRAVSIAFGGRLAVCADDAETMLRYDGMLFTRDRSDIEVFPTVAEPVTLAISTSLSYPGMTDLDYQNDIVDAVRTALVGLLRHPEHEGRMFVAQSVQLHKVHRNHAWHFDTIEIVGLAALSISEDKRMDIVPLKTWLVVSDMNYVVKAT